jgi:hypothetical protein
LKVVPRERSLRIQGGGFQHVFPPHSITVVELHSPQDKPN